MTPNQRCALSPLVSILKAHGVDLVTIDEVMELWSLSCHGIRFVIPKVKKNVPRERFTAKK